MNLTIRNVPDDVHRQLVRSAEQQGRSLNAQIVHILTRDAAELKHRRPMRASRKQLERFVASLPKMSNSAKLIREDRSR
jgi:plasmid stability protein